MKGIGTEALLLCLLALKEVESLQEGAADYGFRLAEMEARELLELIEKAKTRLAELGCEETPHKCPEQLLVTREMRILLPGRSNMEMRMQPLVKALFILFLKHPEGIAFKSLPDHRDELLAIYSRLSLSDDLKTMEAVVDRIVDPTSNSVNTMRTRLSKSLSEYFSDERLLALYRIKGTAGEQKTIELDRKYVIWE